jgi:hypothetical protein
MHGLNMKKKSVILFSSQVAVYVCYACNKQQAYVILFSSQVAVYVIPSAMLATNIRSM